MLCFDLLKYLFDTCMCSMLISLLNIPKLSINGHFLIFKLFLAAIFVTIATVKAKLIPDFYARAIVLINL